MPMDCAQASQSWDINSKAIAIPPEAEPVIPASTVTLTASDTSGVPPYADSFGYERRAADMNAHEEACYFSKARELGDNVAVANFGCRVHDSEQGTDSTGIKDLGHAVYSLNFAPASNQSDDNAAYESDDQSPDTNYVLHFSSYEGNALHVLERNEDIRIPSNEFRNDEVNDQYSQQGEASNLLTTNTVSKGRQATCQENNFAFGSSTGSFSV